MIHWTTHRLLGSSGAYWTTGRPMDDPQASGAFWGLLNNWQANWTTHRLLEPSGAYWTTGRPTGRPTGFWGLLGLTEQLAGQLDDPQASGAFWGLLNNWQANWTTHRLLGPSGAYWTTGRPTGWPTGFWGLLGLNEQLAGQLDDPQASGAFWGLLNNWQANWMTHRLLGPSGAYWTTGRPTGHDPQASGAFWGLLNNWQANWMTHRLLGPSGAYWMTHWMTHSLFNVNWLQDPLNNPL